MFMFHEQCGAEQEEEDDVECEARRLERKDSSRSKLESEDSSYDSDYENSEPLASPNKQHEDVSRQVSDTLGAEFAEYVQGSDPDYTNRIEFALKLGYTEKQAQVALHKLGPRPQQNELLAELIKLGACNQGPKEGAEANRGGPNDSSGPSVNSRKLDSYPAEGYELRSVVIDGSNVAMSHGNKEVFSCRGIKLCVDWFKARGHKDITVFVPMWRKENSRPDAITKEQEILWELEKDRQLVFTPSRQLGGRRMACHDDRYILKLAAETEGVVVSNDNYRDLCQESPEFKRVVEERLLMYSFVNDRFMPPDDPLGRHGPSLDAFLTHKAPPTEHTLMGPRVCPYGKKCTYGNKCKYYHPERGNQPHKSVSEQLAEQSKIQIQEVKARTKNIEHLDNRLKATLSSPFPSAGRAKAPLQRTKSLLPGAPSAPLTMDQPSVTITPPPPPDTPSEATRGWSLYGDHLSVAQRLSDPEQRGGGAPSAGEANNLHRKLQRQLTLNPVYDPRLVHIRNQLSMRGEWEGAPERGGPAEHAPLVRHSSAGAAERRWGPHQGVTRIASAPDSFHPFPPPNEAPPHYVWGLVPAPPPPPQHHHPQPLGGGGGSFAEKRNHLFYHLSSIFNKEQVMAAMDAQPEETDAQAICAAILNTFPHHR